MAFLRKKDYALLIQDAQLAEITGGADTVRTTLELAAQEEVSTYLRQRWDITEAFRHTKVFDMVTAYNAQQLVELNSPAYSSTSTYSQGACVTQAGVVYRCTTAITVAEAFTIAKWTALGNQYDLFYTDLPYARFNASNVYAVGDIVFWKNRLYKCLLDTPVLDHNTALQYGQYDNIPSGNVFPDDKKLGTTYWQAGLTYSLTGLAVTNPSQTAWSAVTAYNAGDRVSYQGKNYQAYAANTNRIPGADVTNWAPIFWVAGDNRNQQLLVMLLNIALHHMHLRIAPKNVPQLRADNYHASLDWLQNVADAKVMVDLPQTQPTQGRRIRYGGDVKNINGY